MYNYNLINPVNITYRNPRQDPSYIGNDGEGKNGSESNLNKPVSGDESKEERRFPNGNKVQIDYTKNKVNIAQVVEDFKSTIAAINAPEDVSAEVHSYLQLVEIESKKENPSREIILSNLKNASKISDKFIEDSLKKPSTVVQDWVSALFLQQVDLKSDPNFVNEAFRVQIPDDKKTVNVQNDLNGGALNGLNAPDGLNNGLLGAANTANDLNGDVIGAANTQNGLNNGVLNISNTINGAGSVGYGVSQTQETQNMQGFNVQSAPKNLAGSSSDAYTAFGVNGVQGYTAPQTQPLQASNGLQPSFGATSNGLQGVQATEGHYFGAPQAAEKKSFSAPQTPSFSAVSYADDFQNSPVNIYDIPQDKVTISEIKPIGQVSTNYIEDTKENLTYSTAVPLEDELSSSKGAVSFEFRAAKNNFLRAKKLVKSNGDPKTAVKLYDEALELIENSGDENLKAAIHFERGKVFDDYDYAELALKDYNSATKCSDNNLKTHAHLKMGRIYDDYVMFDPAVEHYSLAVESSEEAGNAGGKTKALRYLAALFADRYDKENTEIFNTLAIDAACETGNMKTVSKTLMDAGENFEYVGEDVKALDAYKRAAKIQYTSGDYLALSKNYENASEIMERLNRGAKAMNLLSKALLYRQKAELQEGKRAVQA